MRRGTEHRDMHRALDAAETAVARLSSPVAGGRAFASFRDDPVPFVRDVLGGVSAQRRSTGEPYQFTALAAIAAHEHVAIRSGHGVGKTVTLAWAALWWLATRPDGLVIVLAPTAERQGRGVIVREVQRWAQRGALRLDSDGIGGWTLAATDARLIVLTGAADIGRLEGFHAPSVLLLADEAKSLSRDVLDAVAGALTGEEGREVLASTPGPPSGPFYDACRAPEWTHLHVPSDDADRVADRWVRGRARAWGVQSATYQQRVRGEFPSDGGGQLLAWALLHASVGRDLPPSVRASVSGTVLGLDVARSLAGDASAAVLVRDGGVVHAETWREGSLTATAGRALDLARRFRPDAIVVDEGGVGGGLVDRLREVGALVTGVHFGQRAIDPERFVNARAEAYHTLRTRMEAGALSLPDTAQGRDELLPELAAQRVAYDARGRVGLAPKDAIRGELGRSPDLADALALACYPTDALTWRPPRDVTEFHVGLMTYTAAHALSGPGAELADAWGLSPGGDPALWLPPELGGHRLDLVAAPEPMETVRE